MPKKALVYSEINPDGASGKESYSVTVYDKNFNETEITLKDRALVFLCPKDENQKNLLEDFSGTNQNLGNIKSFIIKNDTYTITKNDKKIIISSDAHNLCDMRDKQNFFDIDDEPYSSNFVRQQLFRMLR